MNPKQPPVIRPGCGTPQGALAHQRAGERWCGWCAYAERLAAIEAEGLVPLPRELPSEPLNPVSPKQAARNWALLRLAVGGGDDPAEAAPEAVKTTKDLAARRSEAA